MGVKVDDEFIVKKTFSIFTDPNDVQIVNGQSYVRKPPMWEEKMEAWLNEQEELAKTFPSVEEYALYMKTVLTLSE